MLYYGAYDGCNDENNNYGAICSSNEQRQKHPTEDEDALLSTLKSWSATVDDDDDNTTSSDFIMETTTTTTTEHTATTIQLQQASITSEVINMTKNLIGGGVFSLSGGVARFANNPVASVSVIEYIMVLGTIFGYFCLMYVRVCAASRLHDTYKHIYIYLPLSLSPPYISR